jgi:hypothetical protein
MPRAAPPPHALLAAGLIGLSACYADGPFGASQGRRLEISVQPAEARVGSALGVQPVIEVRDQTGRPLRERIPVTATLSSGDGTVLGTVTVAAQQGIARFTDLRLSGSYGSKTITFTAPGLAPVRANAVALRPPLRSREDRVDDAAAPQVHVIYVLPHGAADRRLDTELDIVNSVAVFQAWLRRASGLQIRFDLYDGALDVSFFELSHSDSAMRSLGPFIVSEIESQLAAAGLIRLDKRYLVYYDGGSASVCGGAAWPPTVTGQTAAVYLRACDPGSLAAQPDAAPGYWEFAALHDLIHTLGVVSPGAPHHTSGNPAHVPEPNDLMYAGGTAPWEPTTVDVNGDDYFAPSLGTGVANLAENPFVERVAAPPAMAAVLSPVGRPFISTRLPAHQPLK